MEEEIDMAIVSVSRNYARQVYLTGTIYTNVKDMNIYK